MFDLVSNNFNVLMEQALNFTVLASTTKTIFWIQQKNTCDVGMNRCVLSLLLLCERT